MPGGALGRMHAGQVVIVHVAANTITIDLDDQDSHTIRRTTSQVVRSIKPPSPERAPVFLRRRCSRELRQADQRRPDPSRARPARACLRSEGSEPFTDGSDLEGGLVADSELVVPGGDGAVALEPADAAFDGVALLVLLAVEGGRPAA